MDLTDGKGYWSIYCDHAGRKSSYDQREMVEPWQGRIVSEQRSGGKFAVLATRTGENNDLYDAYYVIIPHENIAPHLLFETAEQAQKEWKEKRTELGLSMIEDGVQILRDIGMMR